VREINVFLDDKTIQTASTGDLFVFPVSSANITPGKHTIKIVATDANFHTASRSFTLNILPR
jgi:hypothetical protein